MREIVLDTETTGFDPASGDRIVEIGALELKNYLPTGETFHVYINPERDMPEGAFKIHGLSEEFLSDKPLFCDVAKDFCDFIADDNLIIHNASFDMKFLNWELQLAGHPQLGFDRVIDTLELARKKHPGSPNSLDALCKRYKIDNSRRDLHGALLDSELLAEVYLELIGGRQTVFSLASKEEKKKPAISTAPVTRHTMQRPRTLPSRLTDEDRKAHEELLSSLKGKVIWRS